MEFRLLGPLELEGEHGVVSLGSGKQRTLLAILLLHANERLSRERLIDELWGEEPPASAAHSVDVYVSRLRKTLHDAGGDDALATRGNGYLLQLADGESDEGRFRRLLGEAHGAEPEPASDLLSEALALWRGPALADVALPGSARLAAAHLDELRVVALEERIDADLELDRHRQVVGELQTLVVEHPLRERLRAQHMRALYGAGRQADALDSYRDAQRALAELGLEPSPELKALQRQILNHDPALRPAAADPHLSPRRRGRRRWVLVGLAVAVLAGGAAVALALTSERSSETPPVVSAVDNSVGLFDPGNDRLVADFSTGTLSHPYLGGSGPNIAAGLGYVWVCNQSDRTLLRVDPTKGVSRAIGLETAPGAVAVGHGFVWVMLESGTQLLKLDSFGNIVQRISLRPAPKPFQSGSGPVAVASGPDAIWAVHGLASVAKIDPRSGRVLRDTIGFKGALPGEIVPTKAGVWASDVSEGRALRLDPRTAAFVDETDPTGGGEANWIAVAAGAGGIWIADLGTDKVWRVDPTTDQVDGSASVDHYPVGLVVRNGRVWVVCALARTIDEIDPTTFEVIGRTSLGGHPLGIANGTDGLWIAFGDLIP